MKTIKTLMAAAAALTLSAFTTTSFAATAEDPGPAAYAKALAARAIFVAQRGVFNPLVREADLTVQNNVVHR